MILTKAIKPAKFNDKAIVATLEAAAEEVSKDVLLDYELTTATWNHKVRFERLVSVGPKSIDILVGTDDEIYAYVNMGTKPHIIRPRRAKVLAFPSAFTPKTRPGKLTASQGSSGGDTVFAAQVLHPGTEPRNFDKLIKKSWEKRFKRRMEAAMRQARDASGHAI